MQYFFVLFGIFAGDNLILFSSGADMSPVFSIHPTPLDMGSK